jgi:hypothetical protein
VNEGEPLFVIHANTEDAADMAAARVSAAHQWSDDGVEPLPVFHGVIKGAEVA